MSDPVGFWQQAESDPGRRAVVAPDGRVVSFGELRRWSDALAVGMRDRGLRPGDRVAVVLPNVPEFLALQLATEQTGLDLVPVNRHLLAVEIEHVLRDCEPALLVFGDEQADQVLPAADAAGVAPSGRFAVPAGAGVPGLTSLEGVGSPAPADRLLGGTMLYTSGTTGAPRGVRRARPAVTPEEGVARRLARTAERHGWPPGPGVHLVVAPLYHAAPGGFALTALHRGHTLVMAPRFRPASFLRLVERYRVTSTHMVPTMFHRLLTLPETVRAAHDLSSLNFVVHAGAPCPVHEKSAMLDWLGPVVHEYYSSTEGGGTSVTPEQWRARPGTVGRAWPGVGIRILDDGGEEVPVGTVGNVHLRNGERFEYFRDPQKTARAWRDGYFTAGDVGSVDAEGHLFLADRRTDMILSGGVNIYPAEIEQELLRHIAVGDAGVVGVPDAEWGHRVHAVVELVDGYVPGDALRQEILHAVGTRLARFKVPRSLEFVAELPRTETGKLRRRLLVDGAGAGPR